MLEMEVTSREAALELLKKTLGGMGIRPFHPEDANDRRDYLIYTPHGNLYFKFCRDWKYRDEYAAPGEPHTIYATINADLLSKYDFVSLIICHSSGKLYMISKERIREVAKSGVNPKQGEAVLHIPIRELTRVGEA